MNTLRISRLAVIVLALLGGVCPYRFAKAEEPAGGKRAHLSLDYFDAYLEFEGEYARRRVKAEDRRPFHRDRRQVNKERGFEERIGLRLGGAVLGPQFLTYQADASFALTQDHFEEDIDFRDDTDSDSGYLLEYDARLSFLPGKIISGTLYGLRQEHRIDRAFQSTLNERRTGFGTNWVFAHDSIPMELSYDYLETDRGGNADQSDDEHFTESRLHFGADWLISEHHKLTLSYEHAETKQDYQGSERAYETTRDLLTLEHQLDLGDERQHELRTLIHWQEESGDFARDLFEIGPQLTLKHSDSLRTIYKYQFNRERYEGLDVETQRADFQLIHQMYTNLTTTLDLFALYEDVEDDINTTQYGASIDWQYNRSNRFGHLHANLALAYDTEEVDGENGSRLVLDESHTFRDPVALTLRNRNVVRAGIVVTDAANRRIFQLGRDYLVALQGNTTRISRLLTGRIDDNTTVLVDYQYRTPTNGSLDTFRVDFSIEQRFKNGVTPYYRLSYRNQEDDESVGFARMADRTDHHRLGVTYEVKRFVLGTEFEVFDDTVDPYDAFHVNGLWHVVQSPVHQLDLSGRLSRFFFEDEMNDRNVTMVDVLLDHRWRLTQHAAAIGRLAYRFEDDSVAGDTHAWDVTAGLEYVMGDLSSELTIEYDRLNLPGSSEEDIGLYVRIRRELPDVLGRSR